MNHNVTVYECSESKCTLKWHLITFVPITNVILNLSLAPREYCNTLFV